jgi:hypothetical protein
MVDEVNPVADSDADADSDVARCPWCSAALAAPGALDCPSCGAALIATDDDQKVPGLTEVDVRAASRASTPPPRPRSRILAWLSGEYVEEEARSEPGALAPPDRAVRTEILRLELEAEVARLQAESDALVAEATVDGRVLPDRTAPAAPSAPEDASDDEAAPTA